MKKYIYLCRIKFNIPLMCEALEWLKYYYKIDMASVSLCPTKKAYKIKTKWSVIENTLLAAEGT